MTTESRSSTPNARGNGDEEEEQGPRASYSGERRWGAMHRKWRQHGWDTLLVHAVGIKPAMARSLRKRAEGGNTGEQRGFAQRGRRAGGHVPKRRKKGGFSTETRARIKSGPEVQKKSYAQCTRTASAEKLLFE